MRYLKSQSKQTIITMCDYLSIIGRRDGKIAHVASNSHSEAVAAANWRENDQMADFRGAFFVEAEFKFDGPYPGADKICRGEINEAQRKAIDNIYLSVEKLMEAPNEHAERMCLDGGIFSGEEWADVRWKVLNLPNLDSRIAARIAVTSLFGDGSEIRSLNPLVKRIDCALGRCAFQVAAGYSIEAKALEYVGGSVDLRGNASFTAPALAEVGGYVDLMENASFTAPALAEVGGLVYLMENASFTAPALTKCGYVDLSANASFTAPALAEVGGYVYLSANASFTAPALAEVGGNVDLRENASFTAPVLAEVGGNVDLRENSTFTAPALAEVSGLVYLMENASFTAPALTKCGSVDMRENASFTAPVLTKCGHMHKHKKAKLDAPKIKDE